jgi:hypothetical protein
VTDVLYQRRQNRVFGYLRHAQRRRDGMHHQMVIGQRAKLNLHDSVAEPRRERRSDSKRQACFPNSTGAGQRDQTFLQDQVADFSDLPMTTDEARQTGWQPGILRWTRNRPGPMAAPIEFCMFAAIEVERARQSSKGIWARALIHAAFKITEPAHAYPRALRKLLLTQTARTPQLAESGTKTRSITVFAVRIHPLTRQDTWVSTWLPTWATYGRDGRWMRAFLSKDENKSGGVI